MTPKNKSANSSSTSSSQKPSLGERLLPPWLRATIWSIWGAVSALTIISLMVCTLLWLAGAFGSSAFLARSVQTDSDMATDSARLTATAKASQLTATAEANALQLTATADASQLTATAEANASQLTATANASQLAATANASQLTATANASQLAATVDASQLTATAEANALQLTATADASQLAATANALQLTATADASQLTATAGANALQLAATADASQLAATANALQLTATAEANAFQLTATANASQLAATANALQLTATAEANALQLAATANAIQLTTTAGASQLTATANARLLQTSTRTPTPRGVINGPRGFVNVRGGPGSVYAPPLGTLNNGTAVDILGKQLSSQGELWWLISYPAGPGGKGWVLASYVTANNVANVPWVTAPPTPTNTPVPSPFRSTPTATSPGSRPGPTRTPTSTPTPTPTSTPVPPVVTFISPPPSAPSGLPRGVLTLISPLSLDLPSHGLTVFEWEWVGDTLPPRFGFEVSVWLEGEPRAGVHDAVIDNGPNGEIEQIGENRYRLRVTDIRYATGVLGRTNTYWWTVGIVQVNPNYVDYGLEANPARLRYVSPGDKAANQ